MARRFLLVVLLVVGTRGVAAQAPVRIEGTVTDSLNRPRRSVRVILDSGTPVLTDVEGSFFLVPVQLGTHVIRFERIGIRPRYLRVTIAPSTSNPLDLGVIRLVDLPTELAPIVVEAEGYVQNIPGHRDLQQLQQAGFGHLLTAEEIERINPFDTRDLLRRMPGLNVGGSLVSFVGAGTLLCPRGASYIVDGVRSFTLSFINDPTRQIRSIWTYRGAFDKCGVIVVETNGIDIGDGSPVEFGVRLGTTSRRGTARAERIGGYLSIPLSRRFEFYPVAEGRTNGRTGWNVQLGFKYLPPVVNTPIFAGAGLSVGKDEPAEAFLPNTEVRVAPVLFTGVVLPVAVLRLTAEVQLFDPFTDRRRLAVGTALGVRLGN